MQATAKRRRALLATSSLAALVIVWSGAAEAAQISWQGTTSTDWFVGTNWSTNTVPTNADNATVDQGSPNANPIIGINGTSNAATANIVTIGDLAGTTGALTVTTTNPALPASLTLSGPARFNGNLVRGPLIVGDNGTGFLTITNGGSVVTNGDIGNVVIGSVGTGTITVGSATAPDLAHLSTSPIVAPCLSRATSLSAIPAPAR